MNRSRSLSDKPSRVLFMGVARMFQRGGNTESYRGYSQDCHLNIVGCLLTKRLTKEGGSRALQDPPGYALVIHTLWCWKTDVNKFYFSPTWFARLLPLLLLLSLLLFLPVFWHSQKRPLSRVQWEKTFAYTVKQARRVKKLKRARGAYESSRSFRDLRWSINVECVTIRHNAWRDMKDEKRRWQQKRVRRHMVDCQYSRRESLTLL